MPNDFTVPAAGTIEYQYVLCHGSPRTMGAVSEARPGNRSLACNIICVYSRTRSKWLKNAIPVFPLCREKKEGDEGGHKAIPRRLRSGNFARGVAPVQAKLVKADPTLFSDALHSKRESRH